MSARLGRLIYLLDQAAWVSTDALTATVPKDHLTGTGGYVVEAIPGETLRVTYYRGSGAETRVFFVADVRAGKVVRRELLATPVPLTAAQEHLARARDVAGQFAQKKGYKPCSPAPFNTVVMPTKPGTPAIVYLLTAQQEAGIWPIGGNYRVIVAPDGKVASSRPYNLSCGNLTVPKLPAEAKPMSFAVNHLLDPIPTEIHVFSSYSMRMPLFVTTPDKRTWQVRGSEITPAAAK